MVSVCYGSRFESNFFLFPDLQRENIDLMKEVERLKEKIDYEHVPSEKENESLRQQVRENIFLQ